MPDQVAIVGAENYLMAPDAMRTPISSVDTNLEALGYRGAELLDRLMAGKAAPKGPIRVPAAGLEISLELIEKAETSENSACVYNKEMGGIYWQRLSGPLEVRNWRPGDQYQPQGSTGAEKIKTLFQHARIPLWERRDWPILTGGPDIVWARQFGPAARFAAGPGSKVVLQVREAEAR